MATTLMYCILGKALFRFFVGVEALTFLLGKSKILQLKQKTSFL